MFRAIEKDLLAWKTEVNRKPLLIRGARQVGKSYIVEKFGKANFELLITINFELEPRFIPCFASLEPDKIIRAISLLTNKDIVPEKCLLFLDEIQQCPKAIMALRYFKEKMPDLHIIGAGSFLEFVINDENYSQPVGRVQSIFMKPCSWYEYLLASKEDKLLEYLSSVTLKEDINIAIHTHLLEKCREYFILGGMPEVIDYYLQTKQFLGCDKIHASILEYYQRDLAKYRQKINTDILEKCFVKAPGLIAKHFKYVDIDPDTPARDFKPALRMLTKAGIIHNVYHTSANGLPLALGANEKKFKLLFLDIGLAKHALGIDASTLLTEELILINQGSLAEQFVGQELMAYHKSYETPALFYWERDKKGSQAEVDYIISIGSNIYPIEVKAGKTGRLKSLYVFLKEHPHTKLGICISQNYLSYVDNILSVPFYLIHELPRLIADLI
ncbi:MAG: hypothetical protein A3F18_06640 [Legionellales bacterium RIFCSPHIGHO2_12_FULL_37_14]|nr:MAG: hypothetical protein A3F18_06640 [Legionellales bacterium RIFCSPHIGHO2_12_FULL_37_14]